MKKALFPCLLFLLPLPVFSQVDSIRIPPNVKYAYCDTATYNLAKRMVEKELGTKPDYKLIGNILFVGPVIWDRYRDVKTLKKIEGGNMTLMVDDQKLSGKLTQKAEDGKKVWDQVRKEVSGKPYKLRKATYKELQYYWAVINFDIEEPLIIIETEKYNYLVNINPDKMTLLWLDQIPVSIK
jgi:hypothetical protein